MAYFSVKNRAYSTLASGITSTDTTLTVATGEGARFPASNFLITIDNEILLCSSRTGDTFTVTRGQEGTTAAAHSAGASVELRITAGIIQEIHTALDGKQAQNARLNDISSITPTKGNIIVGNGTNLVSLPVGADNQVLTADSTQASGVKWATPSSGGILLASGTTTTHVEYSSTETSIFSITVPGGTLGTNKAIRITIPFQLLLYSGATDNRYLRIRIYYGGTSVFQHTITDPQKLGNYPSSGFFQAFLVAAGSATSQKIWGGAALGNSNFGHTNVVGGVPFIGLSTGTSSINSSINQTLQVTFQLSSASSISTMAFDTYGYLVEKVT